MSIAIRVSELLKMVNELVEDSVEYVEISILEEDEFDGETIPATLHFSAFDGFGGGVDYEGIEEEKISATYKINCGYSLF